MVLGFDNLAFLMGVAFVAGAIDAIAGGGGLLTIPALLGAGIPPVAALATNKLQSSFGTGGAVIAFARKGLIDFKGFAVPAAASLLGSAAGAFILTRIDPHFLAGLIPSCSSRWQSISCWRHECTRKIGTCGPAMVC